MDLELIIYNDWCNIKPSQPNPTGIRLKAEAYIFYLKEIVLTWIERVCTERPYVREQGSKMYILCALSHFLSLIRASMVHDIFIVGARHRTVAYTHSHTHTQNACKPRRDSPIKEWLRRKEIDLALLERIKSWEDGSLGLKELMTWMPGFRNPCQTASIDYHWNQDTPSLICVS